MTLPDVPLAAHHRIMLEVVADSMRREGEWPTYQFVDKQLDARGYDLEMILKEVPEGLVRSFRLGDAQPQDADPVRLTLAGLAEGGGWPEVNLFLRVLQWLVQQERAFRPSTPSTAEEVVVTSAEILEALAPGHPPSEEALKPVWLIIRDEPAIWRSMSTPDSEPWRLTVSPTIRRYRDVFTLNEYLARQSELQTRWQHTMPQTPTQAAERRLVRPASRGAVFLVHGRDTARLSEVAESLREWGLETTVLHEQPNEGRTIIEKFERYAEQAGFAVAILTGDDVGHPRDFTAGSPRARQNVVFETGFFLGALGRARVAVLYEDGVEKPSDIDGLVYIRLDDRGTWKSELVRELEAAGYSLP